MIFRPGQIVLADTNVIIEAHRTGCWKVLTSRAVVRMTTGDGADRRGQDDDLVTFESAR